MPDKICRIILISTLLSACALKNGGDQIGDVPILQEVPILEASTRTPSIHLEGIQTDMTTDQIGKPVMSLLHHASNWSPDRYAFYYLSKDGAYYPFGNFSTPFIPSSGSVDLSVPTQHQAQTTSDGTRILACCEVWGSYATPSKLSQSRFGIWFEKDQANLFSIGSLANIDGMQGAKLSTEHTPTGKATYEVWAWRAKEGQIVSSTLKPVSQYDTQTQAIVSTWHVNFNTHKITGQIIGNADFGADIELQDVHISGVAFSGTAQSASATGLISGAFYGKSYGSRDAGTELGGKIMFDQAPELNAVFGGVRSKSDPATTDTDASPLP